MLSVLIGDCLEHHLSSPDLVLLPLYGQSWQELVSVIDANMRMLWTAEIQALAAVKRPRTRKRNHSAHPAQAKQHEERPYTSNMHYFMTRPALLRAPSRQYGRDMLRFKRAVRSICTPKLDRLGPLPSMCTNTCSGSRMKVS